MAMCNQHSSDKIADVQFLDYPQDRQTSIRITMGHMPYLISEAHCPGDANVDTASERPLPAAPSVSPGFGLVTGKN